MSEHHVIEHHGETLWLLVDKALYWPREKTLLIADLHLGKAASYRALHQPVPRGTTELNLSRLDALLAAHDCKRLVVLGDFLHAKAARAPAVMARLEAWRARHPDLDIVLIRGNHDQHAGDPPVSLGMQVVDEPWLLGPFALRHEPEPHPTHAVLAGHVHPVYVLRGRGRQRLRLPCYVVEDGISLLPAFGEFTGGWEVRPTGAARVYLTGGERVWAVP